MELLRKVLSDTCYSIAIRNCSDISDRIFEGSLIHNFKPLKSSWRYWYADPMLFEHPTGKWIFFEKYDRMKRIGSIGAKCLDNIGNDIVDVLKENFHLSYPCVFKIKDKIYMIPETLEKNQLILYECTRFPEMWIKKFILMDNVKYVDTTYFEINNRSYIMTHELMGDIGSYTRKLIFKADEIIKGKIVPFHSNDSEIESYTTRGAGNFFTYNGHIFRPSQEGTSKEYGNALRFMKVECIENDNYKESDICRRGIDKVYVEGIKNIIGIHTYVYDEEMEIIDVKYRSKVNPLIQIIRILNTLKKFWKFNAICHFNKYQ